MKALFVACILVVSALGCTENIRARSLGGSTQVRLKTNQKLIVATWKGKNLWYLTRAMRPEEKAETYLFAEESSWGMLEGNVRFVESKR